MYTNSTRRAATALILLVLLLLSPMPSVAQLDPPSIESLEVPETVDAGASFQIVVRARNGSSAAKDGYITVSFPGANCGPNLIVNSSSGEAYAKFLGDRIAKNERDSEMKYMQMTARYPLAEAVFRDWQPGAVGQLTVTMTPCANLNPIRVYIRTSVGTGAGASRRIANYPTEGQTSIKDQQGFGILERTVKISGTTTVDQPSRGLLTAMIDAITDNIDDPAVLAAVLSVIAAVIGLITAKIRR